MYLQHLKGMQSSKLGMYVKGAPFVNRSRYTKGVPLLSKMVYKRVRGCTLGWSPPDKTWLSIPRGGGGGSSHKGAKRRSSNRMDKGSIFILSYFKTLNMVRSRKSSPFCRPGTRFSKVPVTFRARNQIFKSKYKE